MQSVLGKLIYITVFGILLLFLGTITIYSFYNFNKPLDLVLENQKYTWEKKVAQIKSVDMESYPNPDMPKEDSMVFPLKECKILYTYEYNGKQYTQSEIGLNTEKEYDNRFQEALYVKLKAMQTVVIYVNPENPNEASILKYDINLKDIGAGIALILFPLFILHWAYIRRKYALDFLARNITTLS